MTSREFAHLQPDNSEIERSVLAQEVETLRNRLGLRQVDVSKECGVNASMLSQWMLGRYKGNVARKKKFSLCSETSVPVPKGELFNCGRLLFIEGCNNQTPSQKCYLLPIRLDVDVDGYRYIDSFSWNLYESGFTFQTFAAAIVRDLDLPECFYREIANSVASQVEAAKRTIPWHQGVVTESLHPIHINLRIKDTVLIDRFEWDLSNEQNDPEYFAQVMCDELGLSGEFEAQIALSIREQLREYSRLIREGLRERVTRLPSVTSAFRDRQDASHWEPQVKYIHADDIPQLEREDFKRMRPHSHSTSVCAAAAIKPNRPPKPVNTFLMFCRERRKKIMEANPSISAKDASKILGEIWQKLSEHDRAKYQPMTDLENERRLNEWRLKENLPLLRSTRVRAIPSTMEQETLLANSKAHSVDSEAIDAEDKEEEGDEDEEDEEEEDEDDVVESNQSVDGLNLDPEDDM
uniref:SWI/SNFrelated matrixassociated actindependent regulator of chromatin putative n=1 Tax=Albugo laibachii Nc14 TaxID=890382 RepID=F0WHW2_9STRA|nr:SWI/SNFrelated matrixassociated actindependent regulator of chromatin putative [Albugo laibachii Nc14]|eukprot:CCA20838.1 SWI/SNFrelated matrixassociated actindependent regulator of chromatin putative [Albugo laibachii Nc14]